MKKKLTLFAAVFCYLFGYSQMEVKKIDGTVIHDGDVFTYNVVGDAEAEPHEDPASLNFRVYNTSTTQSILTKIECTGVENSDGSAFQFCFGGNCFFNVFEGMVNPIDGPGYTIAPGGNSGDSDHFWNLSDVSSTGEYPMDFKFRISMIDPFGGVIGDPINITYRYSKELAVNDIAKQSTVLKNTIVKDVLNIESKIKTTIQIVDFSGKRVFSSEIANGNNAVNLQKLTAGVYIVNIADANGKIKSTKIIKN